LWFTCAFGCHFFIQHHLLSRRSIEALESLTELQCRVVLFSHGVVDVLEAACVACCCSAVL
jgi:hypothetical protein